MPPDLPELPVPSPVAPPVVAVAVARAHRDEWARVLASTARVTRDLDLAEECTQDAFAKALEAWPQSGVPHRPGAWLTTVAANRARDVIRREVHGRRLLPLLVDDEPEQGPDPDALALAEAAQVVPDDRLRLVFTCCHPALARESQVALTLRLICGLSTTDVARAFLVREATMAARITRAKKKIAAARIPYRVPQPADLPERVHAVADVIHLVFTTGHDAPSGDALVRQDLVDSAIRMARMLRELLPGESAVTGLLALMLLVDARSATRVDEHGDVVLLPDQDRSRWDRAMIEEGLALVTEALTAAPPDRYAVEAAIAAVHAEAATWDDTDWEQVVGLYDVLERLWPSPVVQLNRAVAVGLRDGPAAGLHEIERLRDEPALATYPYLEAARADFLARLGRWDESAAAYEEALLLAGNGVESTFLRRRLADARAHRHA
ncbi:RNA polymerase sigma factor [Humibacillus xanthopallidus]|uniref:RNA polymerase sigma factor n=1 Tax=Humibacillus xanthopallidus TaxID=412689 RepID=UPI00384AF963